MQNESYINKKLLRRFENTNRQIVEYAGFLSFRIWFLIGVLILVVVGNGLLLFFSMHTTSASPMSTKSTPISVDRGSSTVTSDEKYTVPMHHKISISLPELQPTTPLLKHKKNAHMCSDSSRSTSGC